MSFAQGALVVGAVLRRDQQVLLVEEPTATGELRWGMPGGRVEPDELLHEAVVREVLEETGLTIRRLGPVAFISHHYHPDHVSPSGGGLVAVAFEVEEFDGEPAPDDPDGLVHAACFFDVPTAIELLTQGPLNQTRVPLVDYLAGRTSPGAAWFWRLGQSTTEPIAVTPGVA